MNDVDENWHRHRHAHDFDASYGWEGVMIDMFKLIAPYIVDKSELFIDINNELGEI